MRVGELSDAAGGRRQRSSHRQGKRHGIALGGEERSLARPRSNDRHASRRRPTWPIARPQTMIAVGREPVPRAGHAGRSSDRRSTPRQLSLPTRSDTMLTRCRLGACQAKTRRVVKLIDRIRHDIQQRLEQLLAEADKLRHALAALDPRERSTPKAKTTSRPTAKRAAKTPDAHKHTSARTRTRTASTANDPSRSTRTAPGETKTKVLAALSSDQALTAGEVAKATGSHEGR